MSAVAERDRALHGSAGRAPRLRPGAGSPGTRNEAIGLGWGKSGMGEMKEEAIKRRLKEAENCPLGGEAGATLAMRGGSRQGCAAKGAFGHVWGHFVVTVLAFNVRACVGRT